MKKRIKKKMINRKDKLFIKSLRKIIKSGYNPIYTCISDYTLCDNVCDVRYRVISKNGLMSSFEKLNDYDKPIIVLFEDVVRDIRKSINMSTSYNIDILMAFVNVFGYKKILLFSNR